MNKLEIVALESFAIHYRNLLAQILPQKTLTIVKPLLKRLQDFKVMLIVDKGYIKKLTKQLLHQSVQIITGSKNSVKKAFFSR